MPERPEKQQSPERHRTHDDVDGGGDGFFSSKYVIQQNKQKVNPRGRLATLRGFT